MKQIKTISNIILFSFILLLSNGINANDNKGLTTTENLEKVTKERVERTYTLEEATQRLEERALYSVIGRSNYLSLIDKNIQIDTNSVIDNQAISAPFPYIADHIAVYFATFLYVAFVIALGYAGINLYRVFNQLKIEGEIEEGSKLNINYQMIKSLIILILLFPINTIGFHHINIINYAAGKVVFYGFGYSSDLINIFIDTNIKSYPSIKIPNISYNDKHIGLNLINYSLCIKKQNNPNYSVNAFINQEQIVFKAQGEDKACNINIAFDLDISSKDKINKDSFLNDYFKINYKINNKYFIEEKEYEGYDHYKSALIDTYTILFNDLLDKAMNAADFISVPNSNLNTRTARDDLADSEFIEFFGFLNKNFEANCPKIYNLPRKEVLHTYDRLFYIEHTALCLSYEITNSIAYPKEINNPVEYFMKDNYVADYNINLCSQNYNLTETKHNFIGSSGSVSFEECFVKECNSLGQFRSNAYNCSSAINIKEALERDRGTGNLGILAFPSIISNSFRQLSNESAKTLFNNIKLVSLSDIEKLEWLIGLQEFRTVEVKSDFYNIDTVYKMLNENGITDTYNQLNHNGENIIDNIVNPITTTKGNFYDRVQVCVKSPLKTVEGFSCGTVLQEYNLFGKQLVKIYFMAKAGEVVARTVAHKRKLAQEAITDMNVTKKIQQGIAKKVVMAVIGTGAISQLDFINNFTNNPTDIPNVDKFESENLNMFTNIVNGNTNLIDAGMIGNIVAVYVASAYYDEMVGGNTPMYNVFSTIINSFFVIGLIMTVVIPMVFVMVATFTLFKMFVNIIYRITNQGISIVFASKPEQQLLGKEFASIVVEFSRLFYQPVFYVFSLIMVYHLTNFVVSALLVSIDSTGLLNLDGLFFGDTVGAIISSMVGMMVYMILFWMLTNAFNSFITEVDNQIDVAFAGKDMSEMNKASPNKQVVNIGKKAVI